MTKLLRIPALLLALFVAPAVGCDDGDDDPTDDPRDEKPAPDKFADADADDDDGSTGGDDEEEDPCVSANLPPLGGESDINACP